MTLSAETRTEIERQRERYPAAKSAVLPALWALQHEFGFLPADGMRDVADLLGLAPSEVQAVATFYSMYFQKKPGDHHAIVCINVSCALRGADEIVEGMAKTLGCASGETSADGAFTWEATVECLGACGGAPAMQIDHAFHENLEVAGLPAILDSYRGRAHGAHTAVAVDAHALRMTGTSAGQAALVDPETSPETKLTTNPGATDPTMGSQDTPSISKALPSEAVPKKRKQRPRPSADDL